MNTEKITEHELGLFSGTEQYHRLTLTRRIVFTDGMAFLSLNGAGWLCDLLGLSVLPTVIKAHPEESFLSIALTVKDSKGHIEVTDGDYKKLHAVDIDYTDFPLPELKMFASPTELDSGPVWVVMLAGEY